MTASKIKMLLLVTLLTSITGISAAPTSLKSIKKDIHRTQENIKSVQKKRDRLNELLAKQESAIGYTSQEAAKSQLALKNSQQKIQALTQSRRALQEEIVLIQKKLAIILPQSYPLLRQPLIKHILNTSSHEQTLLLNYYSYLGREQVNILNSLKEKTQKLQTTQQRLQSQQKVQKQLSAKHKKESQQLQELQNQRRATIAALDAQILSKKKRLDALLKNQKLLEKKVKSLKLPATASQNNQHFDKQKIIWPVEGRIIRKFGTQDSQSKLIWKSILIQAKHGSPVKAVASGTVLFAHWMTGYGQLVIIDHGHGYLSLYGRNERLNTKKGDIVNQGQTIGWVGNTGGFDESALYFSIRHHGEPVNPYDFLTKPSTL